MPGVGRQHLGGGHKHRLGKLAVTPVAIRDQNLAAGAALLPVFDSHVIETAQLPLVHYDPFDRLLIAQARVDGVMAVSSDGQLPGYDVAASRRSSCELFNRVRLNISGGTPNDGVF